MLLLTQDGVLGKCRLGWGAMILIGLGLGGSASGQDPVGVSGSEDVRQTVEQLLVDLDADSLATRRKAAEQLIDLGPDVLQFLPPNQPTDSPERGEALNRIRLEIERQVARQLSSPSRVTLQGTMTLWEALEEICEQTGNDFERIAIETEPVTFDIQDKTYWETIDLVLAEFPGFALHPFRGEAGKLHLMMLPELELAPPRATYFGVFRIAPRRLETLADYSNPALDATVLTLRIRWEPRIAPLSIVHDLVALAAETDRDSKLKSTANVEQLETPVQSGMAWVDFRASLEKADRQDTQLKRIVGSLKATIPAVAATFSFSDLKTKEPLEQRTGQTVVTMLGTQEVNDLQAVQIRVRFDEAAGSLESHRQWLFESPAVLVDPEGNEVSFFTFETTLQRSDEVGISYLFGVDQDIANYRFEYRVPSAILTVRENWEILGLDLP